MAVKLGLTIASWKWWAPNATTAEHWYCVQIWTIWKICTCFQSALPYV